MTTKAAKPTIKSLQEEVKTLRESLASIGFGQPVLDVPPAGFGQLSEIERQNIFESEWGDYVNRREYLSDTPGFGYPGDQRVSQASDRADGNYYPVYQSEQELSGIRGIGRFLCDSNEIAIGARENLVNYTVGTGFAYKPVSRDRKNPAPPELINAIEREIERFHTFNDWDGAFEAEQVARYHGGDGELFLWTNDRGGIAEVRTIEPDYITEPSNKRALEDYLDMPGIKWNYGVATQPGRPDRPLGYFCLWEGRTGDWDYIPAREMTHAKANVPRGVKRGFSDFYAAFQSIERSRKLLDNTLQGSAIQASIAFIREHVAGTTQGAIEGQRASASTGINLLPRSTSAGGGSKQVRQERFYPGKVIDTVGTQYKPGPLGSSTGIPMMVPIFQAAVRIVGVRWQMPEYMISGDASNANFASTMVSGGPFDRASQRRQATFKSVFGKVHWKALDICCKAGKFRQYGIEKLSDLKQVIDLNIEAPPAAVQDKLQTEEIAKLRSDGGILSKRTWATQSGLNYDDEQENKRLEPKEVAPSQFATGTSQLPGAIKMPLGESIEGASKDHWKAYP